MASATAHTIVLRSNNPNNSMERVHEAPAGGVITPGMLLEWDGADVVAHSAAAGGAEGRKVALEYPWSDHGAGASIDHDYAEGETVGFIPGVAGDQFYMLLADGETAVKGSPLGSDGAGALAVITAAATVLADAIVAYAAEAVDNSVGGAPARIRVDMA
jgi:hypothetical protein